MMGSCILKCSTCTQEDLGSSFTIRIECYLGFHGQDIFESLTCTCLQYKSFENTVGKAEIALNEQFLLFLQCFLPFKKHSVIFIKIQIVVWNLFQFGKVYNLSFGEGFRNLRYTSMLVHAPPGVPLKG